VRTSGHGEALVLLEQERDGVEKGLVVLGDEDPERGAQLYLLLASTDALPAPRGIESAFS